MTNAAAARRRTTPARRRTLGTLGSANSTGVVHMEVTVGTSIRDVWAALTDPRRLSSWLGEVEGDLRAGGRFRARFVASGWEGTGRVEICAPPHRLVVLTKESDESQEASIDVTLAAADPGTFVVWEERGMPLDLVAAYGAGIQIHVEDLADHLAGRARRDPTARFDELYPLYQELESARR